MLDLSPQTLPTLPEAAERVRSAAPRHLPLPPLPVPNVLARRRADGSVDNRAPISAWGLVQWAYGPELVRFAGGSGRSFESGLSYGTSATGAVCDRLAELAGIGMDGRGSINARCSAHDDAEAVHAWVSRQGRERYWLLVRAAEARAMPEWDPDVPPGRLVPVLGGNGRPRMLLGRGGRDVIGCLLQQEGVPAHEVDAIKARARADYATVVWLLCELAADRSVDNRLTRWRIDGIGVDLQPWGGIAAAA